MCVVSTQIIKSILSVWAHKGLFNERFMVLVSLLSLGSHCTQKNVFDICFFTYTYELVTYVLQQDK